MEDLSEKEQIDAIKTWWAENGSYVVGGVVAGILIIFGWNYWQSSVAEREIAASTLFEDVMDAANGGNLDTAGEAAGRIFTDYAGTAYDGQARLAMARMYMDNGRDQDAADVLRPLSESTTAGELALVARLRLAKILLYQDKAQEVVELVSGQPESAFTARFNEVLGDAYATLESWAEAEAAYVAALNDRPDARTVDVSLIQLKLNDLPVIGDIDDSEAVSGGEAGETPAGEEVGADGPDESEDAAASGESAEESSDEAAGEAVETDSTGENGES